LFPKKATLDVEKRPNSHILGDGGGKGIPPMGVNGHLETKTAVKETPSKTSPP